MASDDSMGSKSLAGRCTCGAIEYHLRSRPMFVHCCHCTWCQRESGSAFAINALIESEAVVVDRGELEIVDTRTQSGRGQQIARCPECRVAIYSYYSAAGDLAAFVRVGTLDEPDACPPDIHIFTESKQAWVDLDGDIPVVEAYYRRSAYWPEASVARYRALTEG